MVSGAEFLVLATRSAKLFPMGGGGIARCRLHLSLTHILHEADVPRSCRVTLIARGATGLSGAEQMTTRMPQQQRSRRIFGGVMRGGPLRSCGETSSALMRRFCTLRPSLLPSISAPGEKDFL